MPFFLRYVVIYVFVVLVLLGIAAYAGYVTGPGAFTWSALAVLAAWVFGYHAFVLWRDYRRIARVIADVRAGRFSEQLEPERVRESIQYVAAEYGGVPDVIARLIVRRVVTDEVAEQLAERLRASPPLREASGG